MSFIIKEAQEILHIVSIWKIHINILKDIGSPGRNGTLKNQYSGWAQWLTPVILAL